MRTTFKDTVRPFFKTFAKHKPDVDDDGLWDLYCWATAAVTGYCFALGDASIHAMVPFWDMLNHVTGRANVRLNHDADKNVLQMIATARIAKGDELINSYGDLSNGELLRRCVLSMSGCLVLPKHLVMLL